MAMSRMMKSQGQLVMADGSSHLSNDADLGEEGVIIKAHIKSEGGNSVKLASTLAIGCTGVFVERPITEVFDCGVGDNHVFIIDKSGSMRGADKMNRAKNALLMALYKMRPTKKFYVYFFSSGAVKMQYNDGTECDESLFAYQYKVDLVSKWIKEQNAAGGTRPSEALKDAFTTKEPEVIWLLTDGYFNKGTNIRELITQLNTDRLVRVNTVGFGPSPSRVDPGLQSIADENSGTYYFSSSDK